MEAGLAGPRTISRKCCALDDRRAGERQRRDRIELNLERRMPFRDLLRLKPRGPRKRVLAVASGGGHWVQLQRLMAAMDGHEIVYVTTLDSYREEVEHTSRFYSVRDANRWDKLGLLRMAMQLSLIVLREQPDIVISTGAAAGYFCIRLARLMGARTIWVDSLANADCLSLCG